MIVTILGMWHSLVNHVRTGRATGAASPHPEDHYIPAIHRLGMPYAIISDIHANLEGLPLRATLDTALCVHGSVRDPIEEYIFDVATARASFDAAPFALCLVGHTHVPAVFTQAGEAVVGEPLLPGQSLRLQSDRRYIINVGSVGQPRDGDPRAAYLWLDTAEQIATLVRLEYPISQTQQKVLAAGLPAMLAERLAVGR